MNKYFTSDLHFGHSNIIKYSNRPFESVDKMNEVLINNINKRVKQDDVLFIVGDFSCYGGERGVSGTKISGQVYLDKINGNKILIAGNHDKNNKVKAHLEGAIVILPILGKATISHYPSTNIHCPFTFNKQILNYHLCGHIHTEWKHFYDVDNNILNINVGIDAWNYIPVSMQEISKYIIKVKKELHL